MIDDAFVPGTIIKTTNLQEVTLEKELGSGYTAVVYKGTIKDGQDVPKQVAVKIAKSFDEAQRLVKEEYEVLTTLASELIINNRIVTPNVYGKGEIDGRSFIVMEYITGRSIIEEGHWTRWDEKDAIKVFLSIFWFFEELQTKKRFVFPDLKAENFIWSISDGEERLRVIDLGGIYKTTSSDTDPNWPDEVLTISTYLFGILKGRRFSVKLNREPAENINLSMEKEGFTYGTKNLLKRLLSRDRQNRLIDAKAARIELQTINRFWTSDRESLMTIIRGNLQKADSEKEHKDKYDDIQRAAGAVDVLKLRFPEDAFAFSDLTEKIDSLERAKPDIELAKAYLQINQFDTARKTLKQGEVVAKDPTGLHLWGYVADSLEKVNIGQRETVFLLCEKIVDEVEKGSITSALAICKDLANQNETWGSNAKIPQYLNFLTALASVKELEEKGDLSEALVRLQEAREFIKELPDREKIEFWHFPEAKNIDLKIADLIARNQQPESPATHSWNDTRMAVQYGNISVAYKGLLHSAVNGLFNSADYSELNKILMDLLEKRELQTAKTLSSLVDYLEKPDNELLQTVKIIHYLSDIEKSLLRLDMYKLGDVLQNFNVLDPSINNSPIIQSYQREFLSGVDYKKLDSFTQQELDILKSFANKSGDFETIRKIDGFYKAIEEKQESKLLTLTNELWCELLDPQDWNLELNNFLDQLQKHTFLDLQTNLEKSSTKLTHLQNKISQVESIKVKSDRILGELEALRKEHQRQRQNNEALTSNLKDLAELLKETNRTAITQWKTFYSNLRMQEDSATFGNNHPSEQETRSQLDKILAVMLETSRLTGDLNSFREIGPQVFMTFDLLGPEQWGTVVRQLDTSTSSYAAFYTEIDQSIANGDLDHAMKIIRKLDPFRQLDQEIVDRRIHILQLLGFKKEISNFQRYISQGILHRPLLELLSLKRSYNVPQRLLDTMGVSTYLKNLYRIHRSTFEKDLVRLRSTDKSDSGQLSQIKESIADFLLVKKTIQSVNLG